LKANNKKISCVGIGRRVKVAAWPQSRVSILRTCFAATMLKRAKFAKFDTTARIFSKFLSNPQIQARNSSIRQFEDSQGRTIRQFSTARHPNIGKVCSRFDNGRSWFAFPDFSPHICF
jgi:DNA transposition AAA+ family ATPase